MHLILCIYPCWYNSTASVKTVMVPSLETAHRKDSMTCDIKMRGTRAPLGHLATKILIFSFRKVGTKVLCWCRCVCFCVSCTGGPEDMMNAWSYTTLGSWVTERQTEAKWMISVRVLWKRGFTSAPITSAEPWIWRVYACALSETHLPRCRHLKPR